MCINVITFIHTSAFLGLFLYKCNKITFILSIPFVGDFKEIIHLIVARNMKYIKVQNNLFSRICKAFKFEVWFRKELQNCAANKMNSDLLKP